MKTILTVAGIVFLAALSQATEGGQGTNGVKTVFCNHGELTATEVNALVDLATTAGIIQVEMIETLHMHPSTNIQIRVKERETIDGDRIRYRTLNAFKKGWVPHTWKPADGKATVGDFWEDSVDQSDLTSFEIAGHPLRVAVEDGISRNEASAILSALVRRNWETPDAGTRTMLDKVPPGLQPSHLSRGKNGDGFRTIFSERLRSWTISFEFIKGRIVVRRVLFAIS